MPAARDGFFRALLLLPCLAVPSTLLAQPAGSFGETIEVRRVEIDVVVTDRSGHPVPNLTRGDFTLEVGGDPAEIAGFSTSCVEAPQGFAPFPVPAPRPEVSIPSPPETLPPASPAATWVLYFDGSRITPNARSAAAKELWSFLDRSARSSDRFVVAASDGQELRLLSNAAEDRAAAERSISALFRELTAGKARFLSAGNVLHEMIICSSSGGSAIPGGGGRASFCSMEAFLNDLVAYFREEETYARAEVRSLGELLDWVNGIEGRVELVISGAPFEVRPGFGMLQRAQAAFADRPRTLETLARFQLQIPDLRFDLERALQRANASRVTIHTIDAFDGDDAGMTPAERFDLPAAHDPSTGIATASAIRLEAIADATGGRSFRLSPELDRSLEQVARDRDCSYTLAFDPQGAQPGDYREVKVRLRDPALRALYRRGFRARTPIDRAADTVVSAFLDPDRVDDLGLLARADAPRALTPGKGQRASRKQGVDVHLDLPLDRLVLLPRGDGYQVRLAFELATMDGRGVLHRLEPRTLDFEVPASRLPKALSEHVGYDVTVELGPGAWRFSVVVTDLGSGLRSARVLPLAVGKPGR